MTANAHPTTTTTRPRTGARRHAVRFAGVALAAGTLLGGFAQAAHAESPPAPKPTLPIGTPAPGPAVQGPIADAPPGPNTGRVMSISSSTGDTWGDVSFSSNKSKVIVQISTTKPHWDGDVYTMGAVSPVLLVGTPAPAAPNTLATEARYDFTISPSGLTPATTYYVLYQVPGLNGQKPSYNSSLFTTKTRYVRMTPLVTHVSNDSDKGGNAGEIRFGVRVAPDGNPIAASEWGGWTKEYSLDSGDDVDLSKANIGHTVSTKAKTVTVQVQGRENDVQGWDWDCAIQGGPMTPKQYSDHCYDEAYAEAVATLPTGRYTGAHKQVVHATVNRGPALEFQSDVLVETWFA